MNNTFLPFLSKNTALVSSGIFEIIYAILIISFRKNIFLCIPGMLFSVITTIALLFSLPNLFYNAFNPFTLNLSVFALSLINIIANFENKKMHRSFK